MSGETPPRPVLKHRDSKVKFYREDKCPIGTMSSDTDAQGSHHPSTPSARVPQIINSNLTSPEDAYDVNTYNQAHQMIAHSPPSRAQGSGMDRYYNSEAGPDVSHVNIHSGPPTTPTRQHARHQSTGADAYTATPPRVGTRRLTNPGGMRRPTLDAIPSEADITSSIIPILPVEMVSPRTTVDNYFGSPRQQAAPSGQTSAMPSTPPGRAVPQIRDGRPQYPQEAFLGSPRSRFDQVDMGTPLRTMFDQQGLPITVPQQGSPISSKRYDEHDYPVPTSPASYYPPSPSQQDQRRVLPGRDVYTQQSAQMPEDRQLRQARQTTGRHDSEETLQGVYDEKKPSIPRDSFAVPAQRQSDAYLQPDQGGMRRRTTREVEDDGETIKVKGGMFSQLLRLTGKSSNSAQGQASEVMGHSTSVDLPGSRPRAASVASTVFGADEFEPDDPRIRGKKQPKKNADWHETQVDKDMAGDGHGVLTQHKRKRRASVQLHVSDVMTRQDFIMKLAKALMVFGAPSHRVESQLSATALVLEIDAQFIHLPSIVICCFGDQDTNTSETHFIKASGGLDLGKLHRVHNVYKAVMHDEIDAGEGTKKIHELLKAPSIYGLWARIVLSFLSSAIIAPMGFGGSFIDGIAAGCLGVLLSFWQLHVASKSSMYSNIFEISIATLISFVARALSTTGIFCYQAVSSAGVVLILPGYTILCGSLELASKNIVSGSVRMVYAIIYSLFLGFGITIGSDLFYVIDPKARRSQNTALAQSQSFISMTGTFTPLALNQSYVPSVNFSTPLIPFNGSFTFSNQTLDDVTSSLDSGAVTCDRADGLPWWQQNMPAIWLIPLVPLFSILIALWSMQPIRSRQLPVMVVISCAGFLTNQLANHYIFNRSDVVSAIGAFVIGILGNIYSRVFGGTAFTSMVPGVLFLVPSGIAAAGGLAMTNTQDDQDSYSQGLIIGFRMVQVAIGITVGLFGSGLLIYSFGRKKGAALFAF